MGLAQNRSAEIAEISGISEIFIFNDFRLNTKHFNHFVTHDKQRSGRLRSHSHLERGLHLEVLVPVVVELEREHVVVVGELPRRRPSNCQCVDLQSEARSEAVKKQK